MIGSSRETVTRSLADLAKRQIIGTTSDSIVIHDLASLEKARPNVTLVTAKVVS